MYLNSDETVVLGTEFKLSVNITGIDGLNLNDFDFDIECYTSPIRKIIYKKGDFDVNFTEDPNTCIINVDSVKLGVGKVKIRVIAYLPDTTFLDGFRTEIEVVDSGITIIQKK